MARLGPDPSTLAMGRPDWREKLAEAPLEGAVVYHLAARVHHDDRGDEASFMADNAEKTRLLAEAAARKRARRFIFLSSIKVHGEETRADPFRANDAPAPEDAYARSKLAAEQALAQVAAATNLEVTVVRAPLVYGPSAGGNLRALLAIADGAWPLPLAAIRNRRSFVHVDDLARLLAECGAHPQAPGRTYLAAHARSVSTPSLVAEMRRALRRPARLFSFPTPLLELAGMLTGQAHRIRRLTRSLEVDPSAAELDLGWVARISMEQAVEEMALAFRREESP